MQEKPPKPSPSLFSVTLSPLALMRYAKNNWTCPICRIAWQTNQKDAEYHLRVVLMVWRNSDAHKQKKTPGKPLHSRPFGSSVKLDHFDSFFFFHWLFVIPSYQVFSWTWNFIFALVSLSILHLKVLGTEWTLQRTRTWPSTGFTRGMVSVHFPSSFYEIVVCWKMPCGSFKTSDVCN